MSAVIKWVVMPLVLGVVALSIVGHWASNSPASQISAAAHSRDLDTFLATLRQHQVSSADVLTVRDPWGNTPLHWACKNRNLPVVRHILNVFASQPVCPQNNAGTSPLHWATFVDLSRVNHTDSAHNIPDSNGHSPADDGDSSRHTPGNGEDSDMSGGASDDGNANGGGVASYQRFAHSVRSALQLLVPEGSGALPVCDVDARSDDGSTPLHWAVQFCNLPAVEFLLSRGASVIAVDASGLTPLQRLPPKHGIGSGKSVKDDANSVRGEQSGRAGADRPLGRADDAAESEYTGEVEAFTHVESLAEEQPDDSWEAVEYPDGLDDKHRAYDVDADRLYDGVHGSDGDKVNPVILDFTEDALCTAVRELVSERFTDVAYQEAIEQLRREKEARDATADSE